MFGSRRANARRARRSQFVLVAFVTVAATACVQPTGGGGGGGGSITITASSATISYGAAIPAVTPSYAGLPSGWTETTTPPTCTTTATAGSPVGTYVTECSGAAAGTTAIVYVNGTITIQPAAVVVTASDDAMALGGSVPTITASYSGLQNGETAPAVFRPARPRRPRPAPRVTTRRAARARRMPTTRSPTSPAPCRWARPW